MSNVTASAQADALFQFPCDFPIKIMGENCPEFVPAVLEVLRAHIGEITENQLVKHASRTGRYLSLTATFTAHSREQLDQLYLALTGHDLVKAVL